MTTVVDASVVVAALVTGGSEGAWAETRLIDGPVVAPHLLPVEVLSQLRRAVAVGMLAPEQAGVAVADLGHLPIRYLDVVGLVDRIWELRANVSAYDAWYVAAAEMFDAPLATLDLRLARAPGPRCDFMTP
ncbi:type II toxin-antitoxin system VapC family toxin [Nocardioides humi]|uniref:Ribonuclease VapC n=1 Tax=Nocardioides humi TaxID=449461 RepID=A0ABN2AXZ3_9ACTN|nr:type II toxin-antitoxin system VapC family toxin [Nocardioides humi]